MDNNSKNEFIFIRTKNSVYSIRVLDEGIYSVYGGWFDRKDLYTMKIPITGCTWGGSIIKMKLKASEDFFKIRT